ncbi:MULTISPECIES: AAA family ATPase [Carnobacterium]|uniref:Shikimate kinase n=1 Tax=Carnobacterium divergens TaxID=2748 RepID=A0A2R8A3Y7_CARDV|nr:MULTISPECIES: AAA family ATPase [Carnobacterium]MCO6019270.1 AAA family ATPase [Carnobacterium divergens]MDT1940257.1 AAA family ATPase [Carnobacterium divergens]MDT1942695.1 AAA family ATPase [Carnobacterium divergens]MDT1948501.1 AAA family ATPase [Carnobacterium divergens]MDT1950982.1 AAA family ATPase [Carnobacterium divergens]
MSLIVLIGAQAVGKMTVGKELEKQIEAKLLFNHQTIDLFATYLGYTNDTFALSSNVRKDLFKAFVKNKGNNATNSIIFTVLIQFDQPDDIDFLTEISSLFLNEGESVYFIELTTDLDERLKRNVHEERLLEKPSKRNLEFSKNELLADMKEHRMVSNENEWNELFPNVHSLKLDNTFLSPTETASQIVAYFQLK